MVMYITLFMFSMVHIETYIKSLLNYCCENNITERKADHAYVFSIYVFNFMYLLTIHSFCLIFCRKNSIKSYKQYKYGKCFSMSQHIHEGNCIASSVSY